MGDIDWLTARPIAHRGYHDPSVGRIENTLAAADAAIAHDFAIECDVRVTADDRVVVFHDATLERLTDAGGRVDKIQLDDLRTARFRGGTGHIPTLDELLRLVDGRVPLIVELKGGWRRDREHRLGAAVAANLSGYIGPVAVMSFDPKLVAAMRRLAPGLPRGLIADDFPAGEWPRLSAAARLWHRHLLSAPDVRPRFIAYAVKSLPAAAPLVLRHFARLPLIAWTVRDQADRAIARSWADQIIFEGFDPDAT